MTREEAIKIINCYDIGFYDLSGEKIPADKLAEAYYMAIEALSADTVSFETQVESTRQVLDDFAKDRVKVVRCKDCKHKEHCHETVGHTRLHDDFQEHWSETIEWCSRGERKGGDPE